MAAHSLNHVREEDIPEVVGMRSLGKACAGLRQVECTPLLQAYIVEASAIKSLRRSDKVSLSVATIVVMAWNAYRRVHGPEVLQESSEGG